MNVSPFFLIAVFDDPDIGFKGNTAAVILLDTPMEDEKMQTLAADFNQPATTFLWPAPQADTYHVRWFAPDGEIDLCGHGSLAAIAFLADQKRSNKTFTLAYRSGEIIGSCNQGNSCTIYLRAIPVLSELAIPDILPSALGIPVKAFFETDGKNIVLTDTEQSVHQLRPDFERLRELEIFGYAVTAPGDKVDFVSRTFVPHVKQLEDPATGSSHAALVPFWAERMQKSNFIAHQLSARGGKFICTLENNEVALQGRYTVIGKGVL